jgi:hypothetical protein
MRLINLAAVIAVLMALSGCQALAPTVLKLMPPAELLQDCPSPEYSVRSNGDLAKAILAERNALALCNNDKGALRRWADGLS